MFDFPRSNIFLPMSDYVIGHKNPDTDAICSAIAYADLLSQTYLPKALAARCGEINSRTGFVLERAGLEPPRLVMDVRPSVGQICRREVITAHDAESVLAVVNRMRDASLRSIPVIDSSRHCLGMLSLTKLVDLLLPGTNSGNSTRTVDSSLERIRETLDATYQNSFETGEEESFILTVGAMRAEAFDERIRHFPSRQIILVVGNRTTVQTAAIEYGIRAIVITGNYRLSPELLEKAVEKKITVICASYDTATTTLLIKCAKRITHALTQEFLGFTENLLIRQIREKVQGSSQSLFPVIGEDGLLSGVLSKSDLVDPPRTRLVLVDHNELAQAVNGADEAEIIEVLDHHRLGGGLISSEPIRFINEPLGSTCTIVAKTYRQLGIKPSRSIALCMAAGLISDTLHLTSPTTTPVDRELLSWLEPLSGEKLSDFARDFFTAGSALKVSTPEAVVNGDCKEYEEHDWKIAVAQVEELGLDAFWDRKADLLEAMQQLLRKKNVDLAALLITDITSHYSLLLVVGEPRLISGIDYPPLEPHLFELNGIVSRKKQLLPELIRVLTRTPREA